MKKNVLLRTLKNRVVPSKRKILTLLLVAIWMFLGSSCENDKIHEPNLKKLPANSLAVFDLYKQLYYDITDIILGIQNDNIIDELNEIIEEGELREGYDIEVLLSQHPDWFISSQTITQFYAAIYSNLGVSVEDVDNELSAGVDSIIAMIYSDTTAFNIQSYQQAFNAEEFTVLDFIAICYNGAIKTVVDAYVNYEMKRYKILVHDGFGNVLWLNTSGVSLSADTYPFAFYEIEVEDIYDLDLSNIPSVLEYEIQSNVFYSQIALESYWQLVENEYYFDSDPIYYYVTAEECLQEYNDTMDDLTNELAIEAIANTILLIVGPEAYGAAQTVVLMKFAIKAAQALVVYHECMASVEA